MSSPLLGPVVTDASSCLITKFGDNTSSGNDAHGGIHCSSLKAPALRDAGSDAADTIDSKVAEIVPVLKYH